jgi:hypothetical protein
MTSAVFRADGIPHHFVLLHVGEHMMPLIPNFNVRDLAYDVESVAGVATNVRTSGSLPIPDMSVA